MAENNWMKIAEWIENSKKAKLIDPPDDGRPVKPGARSSENSRDVKDLVGSHNVEDAPENPEMGDAEDFGKSHNLAQVPAGKEIEFQKKVKVVRDANLKAARVLQKGEEATIDELIDAFEELKTAFDTYYSDDDENYHDNYYGNKRASYNYEYENVQTSQNYSNYNSDDLIKKAGVELVNEYINYGKFNADVLYSFLSGFSNEYCHLKQASASGNLAEYIAADPYTDNNVADFIRTVKRAIDEGAIPDTSDVSRPSPASRPPISTQLDNEPVSSPASSIPSDEPENVESEESITDEDIAEAAAELGISPEQLRELLQVLASRMGLSGDIDRSSDEVEEVPEDVEDMSTKEEPESEEGGVNPVSQRTAEKSSKYRRYSKRSNHTVTGLESFRKRAAKRAYAETKGVIESVIDRMTSGQFRLKPAADGTKERARRELAKKYLIELCDIALS